MAFIRRVRTKSGATAVQIVEYRGGRQRIVKHVSSAHTNAELGVLLEKARALMAPAQDTLDFEIQPQVPIEQLRQAREHVAQRELFTTPERQCDRRDGPGRVEATSSALLGQVLTVAYEQLGFDAARDDVFRDLVIARIVEPTSKRDAARVLDDLGIKAPSYATIKRHLPAVIDQDYQAKIAQKCYKYASTSGDVSLILYNVTTLYFEAENEDDLRKVGYPKERKVDPQIVVGLLIDRTGFPLEIGCFEGNKAECDTRSHVLSGSR